MTTRVRRRILQVAALIGVFPGFTAIAAQPPAGSDAFPYPGKYSNGWCSLELHADATFEMKSMHCPYPEGLGGPDSIVVSATGQAHLASGRLRIFGVDYLQLDCRGGPRFLHPDELREFSLSLHARDPWHLRMDRGYVVETAPIVDECDLSPMPSALRRIAEMPPITATIVSIEQSECHGEADEASCDTTVVLDRGEAHGLVDDMHLYFPQCPGIDYAMSVEGVRPDSAAANILWSPHHGVQAAWLIGKEFTTRMPSCLVPERERIQRETEEHVE
jgi:hypothetical protein